MPTPTRTTVPRATKARGPAQKRRAVKPRGERVTPLSINKGQDYIDFGCRRVWLDPSGSWSTGVNGETVKRATIAVGDDNDSFEEEHSERFDRFMLAMYELAQRNGIAIPPVPKEAT